MYQSEPMIDPFTPRYDAIVIGSGAGGSTLAYELSRRGHRVLVVERGNFLKPQRLNPSDPIGKYIYRMIRNLDDSRSLTQNLSLTMRKQRFSIAFMAPLLVTQPNRHALVRFLIHQSSMPRLCLGSLGVLSSLAPGIGDSTRPGLRAGRHLCSLFDL